MNDGFRTQCFISIYLMIAACVSMFSIAQADSSNPSDPIWDLAPRGGLTADAFAQHLENATRFLPKMTTRVRNNRIDNSTQPFFRGIFSQVNGSCSQASAVGYIFTYEIDYARNIPADTNANRYPTHFTYNFLNTGRDYASDPFDGWQIVTTCGVPSQEVYGGLAAGGFKRWMTGYGNYYQAMHNRIRSTSYIDVKTADQIERMKQWFDNHGIGASVGGIALFGANTIDLIADQLPEGTPDAGQYVIRQWGPPGQYLVDHLMTFVGYDDTICLDYNGDGRYTNDEDTNGDGQIDLTDWETGAMIIANSWGSGWANAGFIYMPYRLLAIPVSQNGMGLYNNIYTCEPLADYSPLLTMNITLTHSCRNKIAVIPAVALDPDATEPDFRLQLPIFNFQGGPNYMQGGTDEEDKTIEFGIDVSQLLAYLPTNSSAAFFIEIIEDDTDNSAEGRIDHFSLIDYSSGTPVEIAGSGMPVTIQNNAVTRSRINASITIDKPEITSLHLPGAHANEAYSQSLDVADGTPPYSWMINSGYREDIGSKQYPNISSEPLSPLPNHDDGFVQIDLGFSFPFFSGFYDRIGITTDGSILFEDSFVVIRNTNTLRNHIAITPFGCDLQQFPEQGGGIFLESTADSITVRWITGRYDHPETMLDFCTTLHRSGRIEFCYGMDMATSFSFVSGISDGSGQLSLSSLMGAPEISADTNLVWNADAYLFNPAEGMMLSADGVFTGTPTQAERAWSIPIRVTDVHGLTSERSITFMSSNGAPFVDLDMPDIHLMPGDTFTLNHTFANPLVSTISAHEYIILDVYQNYWFWPSWSQSIEYQPRTIGGDFCDIQTILTFAWPDITDSASGLRFWSAMMDEPTQTLLDYDVIEWAYGISP